MFFNTINEYGEKNNNEISSNDNDELMKQIKTEIETQLHNGKTVEEIQKYVVKKIENKYRIELEEFKQEINNIMKPSLLMKITCAISWFVMIFVCISAFI